MAFQPMEIDVDIQDTGSGLNCGFTLRPAAQGKKGFEAGRSPRMHAVVQYRHFPKELEQLILKHWIQYAQEEDGRILATASEVGESFATMSKASERLATAIIAATA